MSTLKQSHSFEKNEEDIHCYYSSDVDSETDPTYLGDIPSDLSNLSIDNQQPESVVDDKDLEIVQRIVQDGKFEKLKVEQCKIYLRKHGLRLTGNKKSLIERIKEHQEILNGGAEKKYPVSSFVLNCKGDACTGDVVMFEQNVYDTYNIASRSATGPPCGTRIVVGRIVKESYGAAKQQHTFTVEVLWSKGKKPLPPLHPLLIKGRNLYRLKTLRQRWEDEGERTKVLTEKHSRGSLARSDRESRMQEKEQRKMLKENRDLKKKQNITRPLLNDALQENLGKHAKVQQFSSSVNMGTSTYQHLQPVICIDEVATGSRARPPSLQPGICMDKVAIRGRAQPPSVQPVICIDEVTTGGRAQPPSLQPQHLGLLAPNIGVRQPHYQAILPQLAGLTERNHYHQSQTLQKGNHHYQMIPPQRQSNQQQQLCRHYPQGRCYYGDKCKFLHQQ